jgi:peptide/nickel transport system permease protein
LRKMIESRFFRELKHQKVALIGFCLTLLFIGIALGVHLLPLADPFALSRNTYRAPSLQFLMGTDNLGRDIFSRVIWGTRVSLLVGVLSAGLSALLGIIIGAIAGYFGGWMDDLLSRAIDIFLIMPIFFLLILVVSLFGNNVFFVILAIGAVT